MFVVVMLYVAMLDMVSTVLHTMTTVSIWGECALHGGL